MTNSLLNQHIKSTYKGVLHAQGDELPSSGQVDLYDGAGNQTAISLGRNGNGISLTGPVVMGELEYAITPSSQGAFMVQDADNKLTLSPLNDVFVSIVNHIFPVGSVFVSTDATNPSTRFIGTTWIQVSEGRFIAGVGTGNDGITSKTITAGNNTGEYNHTLTVSELPSHTHTGITAAAGASGESVGNISSADLLTGRRMMKHEDAGHTSIDGTTNLKLDGVVSLQNTGGGSSHNNTPPSFGVYIWKRTA